MQNVTNSHWKIINPGCTEAPGALGIQHGVVEKLLEAATLPLVVEELHDIVDSQNLGGRTGVAVFVQRNRALVVQVQTFGILNINLVITGQ